VRLMCLYVGTVRDFRAWLRAHSIIRLDFTQKESDCNNNAINSKGHANDRLAKLYH
jgi:hypothetical protein